MSCLFHQNLLVKVRYGSQAGDVQVYWDDYVTEDKQEKDISLNWSNTKSINWGIYWLIWWSIWIKKLNFSPEYYRANNCPGKFEQIKKSEKIPCKSHIAS